MYLYRPSGVVSNPALIVTMHYCTGTAQAYFFGIQYANLADQYKTFIVIYPHVPDIGGCWDVYTDETLTHNAGDDPLGMMVRHAIASHGTDTKRSLSLDDVQRFGWCLSRLIYSRRRDVDF
ncbi:hypothetical protein BDQ17DRAFT_932211 [Cyathus striatus]|nr:hypothetical protein BDQ17DRAFT_932211 [Cyathus striatus]